MLIGRDRPRSFPAATHYPEPRRRRAPKPARLALHGLAQNLRERYAAPAGLPFQHGEIVCLRGKRCATCSYASDASIVAVGSSTAPLDGRAMLADLCHHQASRRV